MSSGQPAIPADTAVRGPCGEANSGAAVVRADHAISRKNGRPMFQLKVPAQGSVTVHYQMAETEDQVIRSP